MSIIGLSGAAGSGKSTAACHLEDAGFSRIRIIGALKAMMRAYYAYCGLPESEIERRIEGDMKEQPDPLLCGATPRYAMQTLGTEWGRQMISPDLWMTSWRAAVLSAIREGKYVVTEDVRFADEADAIRELGGIVVRIEGQSRRDAGSAHASENVAAVTPDEIIFNDASIAELHRKVADVAQKMMRGRR